jgi:hypothetical protein
MIIEKTNTENKGYLKKIILLSLAIGALAGAICFSLKRPKRMARVGCIMILADEAAAMESLAKAFEDELNTNEDRGQAIIDCAAQWGYAIHKKKQFSKEELAETYPQIESRIQTAQKRLHKAQKKLLTDPRGKSLMAQVKKILSDAQRAPYSKAPGHHH